MTSAPWPRSQDRCWPYSAGGDGVEDQPCARPARHASGWFPTLGQTAGAPLGGSPAGFAVQSPVDDPCFELLAARSGLTAPMPAVESSESILAETLPPQTHGIDPAALAGADRPQRKPTTEIENDASPPAVFTASTAAVGYFISSRRSGGLITKGAAMLSSIA